MGLAKSACSWGARCWQWAELRKITCGKSLSCFFFSFITTESSIKREGLWEREATGTHQPPQQACTSFEDVVSRLEHWSLSRCLHDTTSHLSRGDLCSKLVDGGWCQGGKVLEKRLCEKLGIGPQGQRKPSNSCIQGSEETLGWAAAC